MKWGLILKWGCHDEEGNEVLEGMRKMVPSPCYDAIYASSKDYIFML